MPGLSHARYRVRYAAGTADLAAAQALRYTAFRARPGAEAGCDRDAFDARALHLMIEDRQDGRLVCCCRMLPLATGSAAARSYAGQFYDLSALARLPGPMLELGRFCIAEGPRGPDIARLAWGALAAHAARLGVTLIFGCSSFRGIEAERHAAAFALLADRHVAPRRWLPGIKAATVVRLAEAGGGSARDPLAGLRAMPPLLRSYLAMGARVSDHAVVDRDLGTLHVFTGLELAAVPEARRHRLQAPGR